MQSTHILHSSIPSKLLHSYLFRGSFIAIIGALGITMLGIYAPKTFLTHWGLISFIGLFSLIAWGLIPYKRLVHLQHAPYTLHLSKDGVCYKSPKKPLFFLPYQSIEEVLFVEKKKLFGIGVKLKHPLPEKLKLFAPDFNADLFIKRSQKKSYCQLFFPYFNKKAYLSFREQV